MRRFVLEEERDGLPGADVGKCDNGLVWSGARCTGDKFRRGHRGGLEDRRAGDGTAYAYRDFIGSANGEIANRHAVEPSVIADARQDPQRAAGIDAHGEQAAGHGVEVVEEF